MVKEIIVKSLISMLLTTSLPKSLSHIPVISSECTAYETFKDQNKIDLWQDHLSVINPSEEDIQQEIIDGEKELLAQLIEAEAGNQDFYGKCLVADVVLNRVDDEYYPDTIEEVIFQKGQFGVVTDGAFEKAGYHISEDSFKAASMEYDKKNRLNEDILYFNYKPHRKNMWKYGDHYFK